MYLFQVEAVMNVQDIKIHEVAEDDLSNGVVSTTFDYNLEREYGTGMIQYDIVSHVPYIPPIDPLDISKFSCFLCSLFLNATYGIIHDLPFRTLEVHASCSYSIALYF